MRQIDEIIRVIDNNMEKLRSINWQDREDVDRSIKLITIITTLYWVLEKDVTASQVYNKIVSTLDGDKKENDH